MKKLPAIQFQAGSFCLRDDDNPIIIAVLTDTSKIADISHFNQYPLLFFKKPE